MWQSLLELRQIRPQPTCPHEARLAAIDRSHDFSLLDWSDAVNKQYAAAEKVRPSLTLLPDNY